MKKVIVLTFLLILLTGISSPLHAADAHEFQAQLIEQQTLDGAAPRPTVIDDFNADGALDVGAFNEDGTISVFLANGDGTFAAEAIYDSMNLPLLADDPNLFEEPQFPGTVEGTGTYFEVTDSDYIDITFESTEPVHLRLESVPRMITMNIEGAEDADSTQITLGGFAPDTTYYKYEDNYHNGTDITTDADGNCTYTQDLTERHIVFIQPEPSTIFLSNTGWSKPVGTWNPGTQTGTLTQDVFETIQIDSDGITLDGNGYKVTGTGSGSGVYLSGRTGVTITNLIVKSFSTGIYFYNSNNNTLIGNTINSNNYYGLYISYSSNNILTGNTMSANRYNFYISASQFSYYNHDIDATNTVEGKPIYYLVNEVGGVYDSTTAPNAGLFYAVNCSNITIKDQTLTNNNYHGVFLWGTHNSTIENVTVTGSDYGIFLQDSSNNTLIGNTANSNNNYGIYFRNSSDNDLTNNIANDNSSTGIVLSDFSSNNTLTGNSVSDNYQGIYIVYQSNTNILTANTVSNNYYGIYIRDSSNNILTGNTANSNNGIGIYLYYSSNSILTANTFSANRYNFNVLGSQSSHYDHDIDTTNTVDGKPIYYLVNEVGGVYDSTTAPNAGLFYAINCSNITIKDQTITANEFGVLLYNTHDSTIENITVANCSIGIFLIDSSNNTLIGNTVNSGHQQGVGVRILNSNSNTLTANTISNNYYGIVVSHSSNNNMTNNTINSNNYDGIYLSQANSNTMTGNTVSNNGTGINIYYNSSDNTLADNTVNSNHDGITIDNNCNSNTLTDNTVNFNNSIGISLYYRTSGNTLTGNTVSNNRYGISFYMSSDNMLTDNIVSSNSEVGISIHNSNGNTLTGNTIFNNNNSYYGGIYILESSGNLIYSNNFINNYVQARVYNSASNVFFQNFWDDWTTPDADGDGFVDLPYVFPGGQDDMPRVSAVAISGDLPPIADAGSDQTVTDDTYPLGYEAVTLDGSGSYDLGGSIVSYVWSQNGTTIANGVTPTLFFDVGVYDINLTVTDNNGSTDTSSVVITVLQADPATMVAMLTYEVESFNLQSGIDNSLDAKIDSAIQTIQDINQNNDVAAINSLQAFINAVEAQSGNKIPTADANYLINAAQQIIDLLNTE